MLSTKNNVLFWVITLLNVWRNQLCIICSLLQFICDIRAGNRSVQALHCRHIYGWFASAYVDAYYRQINRGWRPYYFSRWRKKFGVRGYTRPWALSSVKSLLHPDSLRASGAVFWKYGYITLYPWQKTLLRNRKRRSHHPRSEETGED